MKVVCNNCGAEMVSESLGYKCTKCQGLLDMKGVFHKYIEQPFMPPQTNFDKITESVESLASFIVEASEFELDENLFTYYNPVLECSISDKQEAIQHTIRWLQQEAE